MTHAAQYRDTCGKCGARRVDQQIGIEATPEEFVARLVEVFREVRRVLHPSGTCWINLGDSYASSDGVKSYQPQRDNSGGLVNNRLDSRGKQSWTNGTASGGTLRRYGECKPKDLIGIPWMTAFALRADGWWLRSEIIWHKLAPMPESVTDRPTKAHEQVFLLAKSATYYYDADAIKEPSSHPELIGKSQRVDYRPNGTIATQTTGSDKTVIRTADRNRRSVWTLGPEPFSGSHYATFPTKLVEPCILAGSSQRGCCAKCLAPWERVVERTKYEPEEVAVGVRMVDDSRGDKTRKLSGKGYNESVRVLGEHWQPTCTCQADVVPCTVLDPFFGSGTVGAVALKHHRNFIGIDLDERNIELAHSRIQQSQPLLFALEAQP